MSALDAGEPGLPGFIGDAWCWALGAHLDALITGTHFYESEVRTNLPENAHAIAAIVATVAMVEAYGRLVAHGLWEAETTEKVPGWQVAERLLTSSSPDPRAVALAAQVKEVFKVRDALVHGHAWVIHRGRWSTDPRVQRGVSVAQRRVGEPPPSDITAILRLPLNGVWLDRGHVATVLVVAQATLHAFNDRLNPGRRLNLGTAYLPTIGAMPFDDAVTRYASFAQSHSALEETAPQ